MSKLDANERWKTKMITPEYADAVESRNEQREPGGSVLTAEESALIRDYILLPHLATMVGGSVQKIEELHNVLKSAYAMGGRFVEQRVSQDLFRTRRELKQRNIRVVADESDTFSSHYNVYFRGYTDRIGMTREVMKAEIGARLARYTSEIGAIFEACSAAAGKRTIADEYKHV